MTEAMVEKELFENGAVAHVEDYRSPLDLRETELAIKHIKDHFQDGLAEALNLMRVSAPVAVLSDTGLNDHLDGIQKPVSFQVKALGKQAEIVQSLAKWKRAALSDYGFAPGEGLYTDMNAIRPDEHLDNFHSAYVDQWDWERVMNDEDRSLDFLKGIVHKIYGAIREAEQSVCAEFPQLPPPFLPETIHFIHSQELEDMYPELTPKQRENRICREKGAVFVIGIGAELKSGKAHDARAADYDDWITDVDGMPGLNGDILVWYPVLQCALELSSMGIRVNRESLLEQLKICKEEGKVEWPFHRHLLDGKLPQTIGGGIGQSRLCMMMLRKIHVGEVQAGVWPEDMIEFCRSKGIYLL